MAEALLTVSGLVAGYGVVDVLRGIVMTVAAGEIVAVLGSNGVGKTTLMRAVSGIYRAASGRVVFRGQDITALPSHRIVAAGLAQAPEGRQVFASMSVRENLVLGGGMLARADFERTFEEVLQRFPLLRQRLAQASGSLSGGEQQMLCIGRALMSRPLLLLLDEPSLGLAPKIVRQIFELVASIREAGTAILLVEQNVRQALKVADHGYVMEGGRIVLDGPAAALRDDPRVRDAYLGGAG